MTDTRTKLSLKSFRQKNLTAKVLMAVSAGMAVCAPSIQAADDQWWFDVEVIVFERHIEPSSISEQFEQTKLAPPSGDPSGELIDLLTAYVKPELSYLRAGLPYCRESKRLEIAEKHQQDFAFPISENSDEDLPSSDASSEITSPALVESEQPTAENFEYEVASEDIFSSDTDAERDSNGAESELTQQPQSAPLPEQALIHAPVEVEFIEWQMPSVFPCVYSEQVDPSLPLISQLTDAGQPKQLLPEVVNVPVEIDGIQWQQKRGPFLLPKDTFRMDELFSKIQKQKNITPILHLNWRQEVVFGSENAKTFRVFAGKNFAGQFDATGLAIVDDTDQLMTSLTSPDADGYVPHQELVLQYAKEQQDTQQKRDQTALMAEQSSEQLFTKIEAALNDETPVSFTMPIEQPDKGAKKTHKITKLQDIWQLDGGIKVYLQNVGRVPYLHIDNHLDYRHAIYKPELSSIGNKAIDTTDLETAIDINDFPQPNFLQSVPFNQLRRVISKQVHYFDHPLFGMIIKIHRHRWPEQNETNEDATE